MYQLTDAHSLHRLLGQAARACDSLCCGGWLDPPPSINRWVKAEWEAVKLNRRRQPQVLTRFQNKSCNLPELV